MGEIAPDTAANIAIGGQRVIASLHDRMDTGARR